mgnify:CR=1 FL=1
MASKTAPVEDDIEELTWDDDTDEDSEEEDFVNQRLSLT